MTTETKKNVFIELGRFLRQFETTSFKKNDAVLHNDLFFDDFANLIQLSQSHNGWFTPDHVCFALCSWANALTQKALNEWLSAYSIDNNLERKKVALILAGNIPLVGFHDFLSVVISGHTALVKSSSNDQFLLPFLARYCMAINENLKENIVFVEGKLEDFDAVIATGSNNTARYFEYYFKNKPKIIRKNRNSIAVLSGKETHDELVALGKDIFRYFGLGCRNVSKLFVPKGYDFDAFFKAIFNYQDVIQYEKYANNYDYNKAVFLMSNFKLLDNGFLTLKEDSNFGSPISSVFYEFYEDLDILKEKIISMEDDIQCIVSHLNIPKAIGFGTTQMPKLSDYADGIDTIEFLLKLT
jgi:Acyl-CoA reductase (LuxC)